MWDFDYDLGQGDDEIGGAQPSGTVIYENVSCRVQSLKPTQAIREQGIIGIDLFVGLVHPHTLDIENNNELEITAPANSPYYGKVFRIQGDPQRTSTSASDSRGYLLVNLKRVEKSRTIQ